MIRMGSWSCTGWARELTLWSAWPGNRQIRKWNRHRHNRPEFSCPATTVTRSRIRRASSCSTSMGRRSTRRWNSFSLIPSSTRWVLVAPQHGVQSRIDNVHLLYLPLSLFLYQIVFIDPRNRAIFTSEDYGKTITLRKLDFTPSDLSFYDGDSRSFLVLDKHDPQRKVRRSDVSFSHLTSFTVAR